MWCPADETDARVSLPPVLDELSGRREPQQRPPLGKDGVVTVLEHLAVVDRLNPPPLGMLSAKPRQVAPWR